MRHVHVCTRMLANITMCTLEPEASRTVTRSRFKHVTQVLTAVRCKRAGSDHRCDAANGTKATNGTEQPR